MLGFFVIWLVNNCFNVIFVEFSKYICILRVVNTINYHIKEIFKSRELEENSVIRKFGIVHKERERAV